MPDSSGQTPRPYYIGLMSGTSLDGIDTVITNLLPGPDFSLMTSSLPIPERLREEIRALNSVCDNELERAALLDRELGILFAEAVHNALASHSISATAIRAIGSHGQTLRHAPNQHNGYTLQVGDPNTIAELTGIPTVADFRRRDVAAGGQGAPLVPAFHRYFFAAPGVHRTVINIGGMANITYLPAHDPDTLIGFDTGPGNVLMNEWNQRHLGQPYDANGQWAQSGTPIDDLLEHLLSEAFFHQSPPKSTGRELFSIEWLDQQLLQHGGDYPAADVQATLLELTAVSISQHVQRFAPDSEEIYICGGGAYNAALMERLAALNPAARLTASSQLGIEPCWVEATAFAWLAKQCLEGASNNCPTATGSSRALILGGIYQ